ncbi:MAG: hypothetical protein RL154_602 [Pseudomonadota bacterium]|jgi:purine-nucleoside phosphorylase
MILCAGRTEQFGFAKPIGVGLVESAIGTTLLAQNQKEPLIFIGTAGTYNEDFLPIGSLCFIKKALQFELRGETPIEQIVEVKVPEIVSHETIYTICNSSSYITTARNDAQKFFKHGAHIENMELFSIFSVAQKFNLEAVGILYITNICNQFARKDYIKNLPIALKALENAINI